MFKKIETIFVLSLFAFVVGACGNMKKAQLQMDVENINKQCPLDMGMLGELTSVTYDEDENAVNFNYTIDEGTFTVADFRATENEIRNSLRLTIAQESSRELYKEIIDAGASFNTVLMSGSNPDNQLKISFSNEELKQLIDMPLSEKERKTLLLSSQIATENARCPYLVEDGMLMTSVKDNDKNVVYNCRLDEKLYDIEEMADYKSVMKNALIETFSTDVVMQNQIQLLVSLNKGIVYNFYGSNTGKSFELEFSPSELRSYLK